MKIYETFALTAVLTFILFSESLHLFETYL